MPAVSIREAIEKLSGEVKTMRLGDLLEFYNELYPYSPKSEVSPPGDGSEDRRKILDQLGGDIAIEEIVDLWNITFPRDRNVYYDDEAEAIRYNEEPEFHHSVD